MQMKWTQVKYLDNYLIWGKYLINIINYSRLYKIPWVKQVIGFDVSETE